LAKQTPETEIKQKIYLSAKKLFVEKGYHRTSIPDIVKDAGVSIGAIYHHFSSKEELARVIHEDAVDTFLHRYQVHVDSQETAFEKIRGFVEIMFNWADEDMITVNYLLHARPKEILDCNFTICTAEGLEAVKNIVKFGQKEGTFKDADPILLASFISGPIMRMIELKTDGIITQPLADKITDTSKLIFDALKK